jgi:hypothetical protein
MVVTQNSYTGLLHKIVNMIATPDS